MIKNVGGVIVAAGLSSRMGSFKPLLPFRNKTIIGTTIDGMLEVGINEIVIILGFKGKSIESYINKNYNTYLRIGEDKQQIRLIYNHAYANSDMLESVKLGIQALRNCEVFFVIPADIPAIHVSTYKKIIYKQSITKKSVVFPTVNGKNCHPPLIHKDCGPYICNYKDKGGLKMALNKFEEETAYVKVNDIGCMYDADTKEDYEKLIEYDRISFD